MEFIQHNILLVAAALISGGMLLFPMLRGRGAGGALSPNEATLLINREDAILIDVREDNEWAEGHAPSARHIPLGQLAGRIGELEKFKQKPVIVICRSGNRSATACATLRKNGFEKPHNLAGGISAWQEAGLPVVKR
jgi:rhodanese-related sulfurtransferase